MVDVIRAVVVGADGRRMILLGLDRRNVERLTAGQPILVRGETLDMPGLDVLIAFGETLQALAGELRAQGIPVPTVDAEPPPPGKGPP